MRGIRYNIYTEATKLDDVYSLMREHKLDGMLSVGTGLYKGEKEDSLVITTVQDMLPVTHKRVYDFVEALRKANAQESVLVTEEVVEMRFVDATGNHNAGGVL